MIRVIRALAPMSSLCALLSLPALAAPPLVPYPVSLDAGSAAEQAAVMQNSGSTVVNGARMAEAGQAWAYGFAVNARESCILALMVDDNGNGALPQVAVVGPDNKLLPIRTARGEDGAIQAAWIVPDNWPIGARIAVIISAKTDPVRVLHARFSVKQPDKDGNGIPDTVTQLLLRGLPAAARVTVRHVDRPYTSLQTPHPPNPLLDIPTDALFVYSTNEEAIRGWQARGYTVWTMGGSRAGKQYADGHPDELQVEANGKPLVIGDDSYYLTPSANRNSVEKSYYDQALANGSQGVCPEEPEFFADAGFSNAFKLAWKARYGSDWQAPNTSIDNAWRSGKLMAAMETDHVSSVLKAADSRPSTRRMVALHSPINYAQWAIVAPQYSITSLPQVQDVVGQVWTGTARSAVRYAGNRSDRTFSLAYLEYSSLCQLIRGTGKRMWFLMDPLEDDPTRAQADYKSHYEQTLVAALLFPDVDSYEAMPWPDRILGHVPPEYTVEINSALAALQDMHNQKSVEGNPLSGANIGVFVSDSMQWQRSSPFASDFDGLFGLMLPLLERGVPVQALSLDRAADPGYLRPFKTLLLSYDFQKPEDARIQTAIADWVRHGGTLLFFGGTDAYNAVADSWWVKAGFKSPVDDLWAKLGLQTGGAARAVRATEEDGSGYEKVAGSNGAEHNLRNREKITIDLSKYSRDTGSVAIRFSDATPNDGWGPWLASTELRVNGRVAASFASGSDIESRFLVYDKGSEFRGDARFADKTGSWTYQFDNLPPDALVQMTVDIGNGYLISAEPVQPIFGHTLLGTQAVPALSKAFPRLRIGSTYPATIYPGVATMGDAAALQKTAATKSGAAVPLYTLRSGGAPIWMRSVGDGLVIDSGVAPGFFSASSRSAGLLRALVQYGQQRAGAAYREPRSLRLRRGPYTIIHTFTGREVVEGRTIDLLSPTLSVVEDRVIPPDSQALLYDLGDDDQPPHIGFVSGRVEAQVETGTATGYFARGALHTTGVARLHAGGHALAGARAMDRLGRPVDLQAEVEGDTVLLRYPNDPDGVIVRVGWK